MALTRFCAELPSRFAWFAAGRWHELRLCWYRADKGLWALVLTIGLVVATFGFALQAVFAHQDDRRNLTCLARNVYFEARGEPAAGQYAVAEVTMNRKASGRYPLRFAASSIRKTGIRCASAISAPFRGRSSMRCPRQGARNGNAPGRWPTRSTIGERRRCWRVPCTFMRPISSPTGQGANSRLPGSAGMSSMSRMEVAAVL